MVTLSSVVVGDAPAAWAAGGFRVVDGATALGDVVVRCSPGEATTVGWGLADVPSGIVGDIDGIPVHPSGPALDTGDHPNRVTGVDHVVVRSPDLDRTTDALLGLGLDLRRIREVPGADPAVEQRFFRFSNAIVELVGPAVPAGTGTASIWGLALVVDDIDATATFLGDRCSAPKTAVQPGRRIATLRTRDLGIGITVAFMTPHVRA